MLQLAEGDKKTFSLKSFGESLHANVFVSEGNCPEVKSLSTPEKAAFRVGVFPFAFLFPNMKQSRSQETSHKLAVSDL